MLELLKDKWRTARLGARYRRILQEQVLEMVEQQSPQPVQEDPGRWLLLGDQTSGPSEQTRKDIRSAARRLAQNHPHARNILRLLEIYVVGPGLKLSHHAQEATSESDVDLATNADRLWRNFLRSNRRHFSFREFARRTWRDGECFLRLFSSVDDRPTVRFVDPERIGPTRDTPESQGILTAEDDVETPLSYLQIDPETGELAEEIPADEMLHARIGVDSNQKRGLSLFAPMIEMLGCFDRWLETEMTARKLQASIVLWRKVTGSPAQARGVSQEAASGSGAGQNRAGTPQKERYGPGSILTTSGGTDLQFLQPKTNFGDAVPLGRMMLLSIAAGAGLPEFMLTSDASNANFASTMVAEGPAVKMFQSEQNFFAAEFENLWSWVMTAAIDRGELPIDFFEQIRVEWNFPELVNRDRPREREADVRLVEQKILSRAEVARREKMDPDTMRREIADEEGALIDE
ncbi:MAG: phage portal protein [Planctomycetaceae bacterium]|nr:phage portal protein [Planctomycetaceae bacterium]